jgi:hypothetical protein
MLSLYNYYIILYCEDLFRGSVHLVEKEQRRSKQKIHLKEMPTDNCQHDYIAQFKSITMKRLSYISILSLVSYHIIESCIDLNTYEKNQKH